MIIKTTVLKLSSRRQSRRQLAPARGQMGAAIVTALLIVVLVVSLLSILLGQQATQLQRLELQRDSTQAHWLRQATTMWIQVVLNPNGAGATTHLGQTWAVPLKEVTLESFLEKNEIQDSALTGQRANLSGFLSDAQARYNLFNTVVFDPKKNQYIESEPDQAILQRIVALAELPPTVAAAISETMLLRLNQRLIVFAPAQIAPPLRFDEFLPIANLDEAGLRRLLQYAMYYPERTKVNLNTAPLALISALIPDVELARLQLTFNNRTQLFANSATHFFTLTGRTDLTEKYKNAEVATQSNLFFLHARVELNQRAHNVLALVRRAQQGSQGKVIWQRTRDLLPI